MCWTGFRHLLPGASPHPTYQKPSYAGTCGQLSWEEKFMSTMLPRAESSRTNLYKGRRNFRRTNYNGPNCKKRVVQNPAVRGLMVQGRYGKAFTQSRAAEGLFVRTQFSKYLLLEKISVGSRPVCRLLKRGCEFKSFYKGGANLNKLMILRPKLGV